MTSSFTGGINAPFNVLTQRALNLLDLTDPVAARQNIGAIAASDLKTLTFGYGLVAGTYNPTTAGSVQVDSDAAGSAGKVVKTDTNGDLTTTAKLNFGTSGSYIQRIAGTNGAMSLVNTGSGTLQLNSGAGSLQLVSASSTSSTTKNGTTIALTSDPNASHTALIVDGSGGNTGSLGLSVTQGATIDKLTVSGDLGVTNALTVGGASTLQNLTVSGTGTFQNLTVSNPVTNTSIPSFHFITADTSISGSSSTAAITHPSGWTAVTTTRGVTAPVNDYFGFPKSGRYWISLTVFNNTSGSGTAGNGVSLVLNRASVVGTNAQYPETLLVTLPPMFAGTQTFTGVIDITTPYIRLLVGGSGTFIANSISFSGFFIG
jgi:hypothetical protein